MRAFDLMSIKADFTIQPVSLKETRYENNIIILRDFVYIHRNKVKGGTLEQGKSGVVLTLEI